MGNGSGGALDNLKNNTGSTNVGYILDPKYLGIASLLPLESVTLENQGAGDRGYVKMAATLVCKSPQAHGKIAY